MHQTDGAALQDRFVPSPIFDNWFKKHHPQRSLLICTPYIKQDALERVISLYKLRQKSKDFRLQVLIRGNPGEFTSQKSSDLSALETLGKLACADPDHIRRVQNLHMKAYLVDDTYLLLTSANLTNSGMFVLSGKENFEGGICTAAPQIVAPFLKYFQGIWQQGQPLTEFYDALVEAYTAYIENEYTEKKTVRFLQRQKYVFPSQSVLGSGEPASSQAPASSQGPDTPSFSLRDIPPVGSLEHLPQVLRIVGAHPQGISFLELGRQLRKQFGDGVSDSVGTNRKFGEEKGKFAAFLDLVTITQTGHGKLILPNKLGKAYLSMGRENREKMIKDIFFEKPIVVSLMRKSFASQDFDLYRFLVEHCQGSELTLQRKVGPLKELFAHIRAICTEAELQEALQRV